MTKGCMTCFRVRYYGTGAFLVAEAVLALLWLGVTIRRAEQRVSPFYHFTALYFMGFQLLNFAFNMTVGALIFWERARRTFFTDRCEDHKYSQSVHSSTASQQWAVYFCDRMGRVDPGHCA